jgi:hypothetical protein
MCGRYYKRLLYDLLFPTSAASTGLVRSPAVVAKLLRRVRWASILRASI